MRPAIPERQSTVPHLRVARPVSDLERAVSMYSDGLGLLTLARFVDHDGFDGVMLGYEDAGYHFEFTRCRPHPVRPTPSCEDLFVLYLPQEEAWSSRCACVLKAGFREVMPFNPYWRNRGRTFMDLDGYSLVLQRDQWTNHAAS